MKRAAIVLVAVLAGCKEAEVSLQPNRWPPLANYPAISGRAATVADVDAGRAAFVLQDAGKPIGRPLDLKLPQYAYPLDAGTKQRKPCVIIQAEEARGQKLVGCRILPDGGLLAATLTEFELLGNKPPADRKP